MYVCTVRTCTWIIFALLKPRLLVNNWTKYNPFSFFVLFLLVSAQPLCLCLCLVFIFVFVFVFVVVFVSVFAFVFIFVFVFVVIFVSVFAFDFAVNLAPLFLHTKRGDGSRALAKVSN